MEFLHDNNPLKSYVSLIDIRNHEKEDNLRSAKFIERSETVMKLLRGLGFSSAADWCRKIDRAVLVKNWQDNIIGSCVFESKRLNELWNMTKTRRIDKDMSIRQVMFWINTLLKPFALVLKADHGKYFLGELCDIKGLIRRKNDRGTDFKDGENLLDQLRGNPDLYVDVETGEIRHKKKRHDEIEVEFEDEEQPWKPYDPTAITG